MAHLGAKNITQAVAVAVGTPEVLEAAQYSIPYPITIKAVPGNIPGDPVEYGTMLVEFRIDPTDEFTAWPAGTVSATTIYTLNGPVEALRFTAAVVDGTVRISQ